MPDIGIRNRINLIEKDLDESVYRIYSLDRFKEMLSTKKDALMNPARWDDPFENFFLTRTKVHTGSGELIGLENLSLDWYGQCWSLNQDTDAMWRIYSPDKSKVGIKVRTTIRRLYSNLCAIGSEAPYLQFFVGKVTYMDVSDIVKMMRELTFYSIAIGGQGDRFAQLLCIKRKAFEHENEVRILFQDLEPRKGADEIMRLNLDPNSIFDEAVIDPRLSSAEAKSIKDALIAAGCKLNIYQSQLYQAPEFVIPIE